MALELFDAYGKLRIHELSEEEVSSLSDSARAVFFKLVKAATVAAETEQALAEARQAQNAAMRAVADAEETHRRLHPPIDSIDAFRAVLAAQAKARAVATAR